jgi:hypothetical protein
LGTQHDDCKSDTEQTVGPVPDATAGTLPINAQSMYRASEQCESEKTSEHSA